MNESQIGDTIAQLKANGPAIALGAASLGTKLRAAWHGAFDLADYFRHHGGLLRYVGSIFWNREGGRMILAQADLGQLPAGFLKDAILLFIAAVIIICLVVGAIIGVAMWMIEKRREAREQAAASQPAQPVSLEQPVLTQKIFPAATIRELNDVNDRHEKRLDGHDVQITALWNTMREEDKQIRKEIAEQYQVISRQLGRIEGKLEGDQGH